MRCRKWSCDTCASVKLRMAQHKARAGHPERHIVLTLPARTHTQTAKDLEFINRAFGRLVAQIRKEFSSFEYMRVVELQKNGTPHLHVLCRGTYIPFKWLSQHWQKLTGAWMVHIKAITRTSNAINELTKYLAKTARKLEGTTAKINIITTSKHWIIDPPDKDPSYSEMGWVSIWLPTSVGEINEALAFFSRSLVTVKDTPGLFTLNTGPPPKEGDFEAVLAAAPDYMKDVLYMAESMLCGPSTFRDFLDVQYSRPDGEDPVQVHAPTLNPGSWT